MRELLFGKLSGLFAATLILPAIVFGNVSIGDSFEEVEQALGAPEGRVETSGTTVYIFNRGKVIFRNGSVVSQSLISEEEAQKLDQEEEQQRQERHEQAKQLLEQIQKNPELAGKTGREKLAFWETFQQRFPEIDVSFQRSVVSRQIQAEEQQEGRDFDRQLQEVKEIAEVVNDQRSAAAPGYYSSGFPLIFSQPYVRPWRKKPQKEDGNSQIKISRPPPLPPTPREKAMPLQQYDFLQSQQVPFRHSHRGSDHKRSHFPHDKHSRNHRMREQ